MFKASYSEELEQALEPKKMDLQSPEDQKWARA